MMSNLAEPHWINMDCQRKALQTTVCEKNKPNSSREHSQVPTHQSTGTCKYNQIKKKMKCYKFQTNAHYGSRNNIDDWALVESLLHATSAVFPPLMWWENFWSPILRICKWQLNTLSCKQTSVNHAEITLSVKPEPTNYIFVPHLFPCSDGTFVSQLSRCDGDSDCPYDSSDEDDCVCNTTTVHSGRVLCKYILQDGLSLCGKMFFKMNEKCLPHVKESEKYFDGQLITNPDSDHFFMCENGNSIPSALFSDLIPDCASGEDEAELASVLNGTLIMKCVKADMLACHEGHEKCFLITEICSYALNKYWKLVPCRNGKHLEYCKEFECNMRFKCPLSHCIPHNYLCDGKWDCLFGYDELVCPKMCLNMYKCGGAIHVCVYLGKVCDGEEECPQGDDEMFCDLNSMQCPHQCSCFMYAIHCSGGGDFNAFRQRFPLISVSVSSAGSIPLDLFQGQFPVAKYFSLRSNCITFVCGKSMFPQNMALMDAGKNCITKITSYCFESYLFLRILRLDRNFISSIEHKAFVVLPSLRLLDLSSNPLQNVPPNVVLNTENLALLALRNVSLKDIALNAFPEHSVHVVDTDDFHLCCITSASQFCTANIPWYISCTNLLPNAGLKIFVITTSLLIICFNLSSIIFHLVTRKYKKAHAATVVGINFTDMLSTIYLCIIWVSDIIFDGTFHVQEENWRSSVACFAAYDLILWFTLLSQLSLGFLSLSRLMYVIYSGETAFKETVFVIKVFVVMFAISFLMAVGVTVAMRFTMYQLPFSLCLPFLDPTDRILLIKVTTWFAVISQLHSSLAILWMHTVLIYKILSMRKLSGSTVADSDSSVLLVAQLVTITVSNILCWFPANGIYLAAMFLDRYPMDLAIWTTLAALPINSLINPSVLLITGIRHHLKTRGEEPLETVDMFDTCTQMQSETLPSTSAVDELVKIEVTEDKI